VVCPSAYNPYGSITTSKSGNTVTIDYGPLITTMTNFAEAVVQTPSKYSINQF
jgi:hypothetical protein